MAPVVSALKVEHQSRMPLELLKQFTGGTWALGLFLAMATITVYQPVDKYPFIHTDDPSYVTENAHVQSGLNRNTLKWALTTYDAANWHPLTWLSHALDCQLFGVNPARHHDMNVTLHAINVVLLFWVLAQATGFPGRSLMVAALFAFHPINVESVAWIAERKTLLSMLFFLLALGAYRWYARKLRVGPYLLVILLYALAVMAKPQAITFPCVLLLWDYWPLRRMSAWVEESSSTQPGTQVIPRKRLSWLILEKVPLLAISVVSAKLTIAAQFGSLAETWFPMSIRFENAIVSYARYLGKAIWPADLAFLYPHPLSLARTSQLVPSILLLVGISVLVVLCRGRRSLTVGWLWFLGTLVPMIGVIQVGKQAMADRYAYLPFVGIFIMICWGAAELASEHRVPVVWQASVSFVVLGALIVVTHRQIRYWSDDEVLWSHTLRVTTRNWGAEDALGTELWRQGRIEEAAPHFLRAVEILPYDYTANEDLGTYEALHGNTREAIERFKKTIDLESILPAQRASALNNLGQAYLQQKDYRDAQQSFTLAIRVNPKHHGAWIGLGVALQQAGKPDMAVKAYSHAIRIQHIDWVYLLLARALEQSGHKKEAQVATEQARLVSQDFAQAVLTADHILGH